MLILTNNPLVQQKLSMQQQHAVQFCPVKYQALLVLVRDQVHQGHRLLTHPLSGSVKPNETPYKSVAISNNSQSAYCVNSLMMIEDALLACDRFAPRDMAITPQMDADFQLVDWTLLASALEGSPSLAG